jgi:hypothetical protein
MKRKGEPKQQKEIPRERDGNRDQQKEDGTGESENKTQSDKNEETEIKLVRDSEGQRPELKGTDGDRHSEGKQSQ